MNAAHYIAQYQLTPHPEGGHYRRLYESNHCIDYNGLTRPSMTAIYYLLQANEQSHWHRIDADELWSVNIGTTEFELHIIHRDETYERIQLGKDTGQFQFTVPADTWFAAKLVNQATDAFALATCAVSPGFCFERFELADRDTLIQAYPQHQIMISAWFA